MKYQAESLALNLVNWLLGFNDHLYYCQFLHIIFYFLKS